MGKKYIFLLSAVFYTVASGIGYAEKACKVFIHPGQGMPQVYSISDNGRYVVGLEGQVAAFRWDLVTNTIDYLSSGDEGEESLAFDVDDQGTVVGYYYDRAAYWKDGSWVFPPAMDKTAGMIYSIVPDGRLMGGWVYTPGKEDGIPVIWKNGEIEVLDVPEVDHEGKKAQGHWVASISADGNICSGIIREYFGFPQGLLWKGPDYACDFVYVDSIGARTDPAKPWIYYEFNQVSPNGEWVTGVVHLGNQQVYPLRYHIPTGEYEMLDGILGGTGYCITNAGTVFAYVENEEVNNPFARTGYVLERGKEPVSVLDYLKENYAERELTELLEFTAVASVTGDGKAFTGCGASVDEIGNFDYYMYTVWLDERALKTEEPTAESKPFCRVSGDNLYLPEGTEQVGVLDLSGRQILNFTETARSVSVEAVPAGIYLVRFVAAGNMYVQKIVIE